MKGKYELIYTGGGIYISQYEKDGYAWVIDSDMPCCLTQYRIPADGDELYMDENIVWSIDVNEGITAEDKKIYRRLYKMLVDEGCWMDPEYLWKEEI